MLCGKEHKNTHIGWPKQNQATQIMHTVQAGHGTTIPVFPRLAQPKIFEHFEIPFFPASKPVILLHALLLVQKCLLPRVTSTLCFYILEH